MDAKDLAKALLKCALIDAKPTNTNGYFWVNNCMCSLDEIQNLIEEFDLAVKPRYKTDENDEPIEIVGWWYK